MQVMKNWLYILVEGEPESPEVSFLASAIQNVVDVQSPGVFFQPIEVGGCGSFNLFAKRIYDYSELHQTVPVIAIADNDYKIRNDNFTLSDNLQLIHAQKPRILYWPRHEWENYLLEETGFIASWVNELPSKSSGHVPYKRSHARVTRHILNNFLRRAFRQAIQQEYRACLKYHLTTLYKIERPKPEIPDNLSYRNFENIQRWFCRYAHKLERKLS